MFFSFSLKLCGRIVVLVEALDHCHLKTSDLADLDTLPLYVLHGRLTVVWFESETESQPCRGSTDQFGRLPVLQSGLQTDSQRLVARQVLISAAVPDLKCPFSARNCKSRKECFCTIRSAGWATTFRARRPPCVRQCSPDWYAFCSVSVSMKRWAMPIPWKPGYLAISLNDCCSSLTPAFFQQLCATNAGLLGRHLFSDYPSHPGTAGV